MAYGAMMTALFGLMLLINRLTGAVFENLLIYAYPLPLLIYSTQYGLRSSWMVLAAMVLMAFVLSTPAGFLIGTGQAFLGMIYGCMVHAHVPKKWIVLVTMAVSAFFAYLQMIVFAGFFGYDNEADIEAAEQTFYQLLKMTGMQVRAGVNVHVMMEKLMVFAAFIVGAIDGILVHLLSELLLKRFHMGGNKSS